MERTSRVYRLGGSLVVTLPIDWAHANRLGPESEVEMVYDDNSVTIRPVRETARRKG